MKSRCSNPLGLSKRSWNEDHSITVLCMTAKKKRESKMVEKDTKNGDKSTVDGKVVAFVVLLLLALMSISSNTRSLVVSFGQPNSSIRQLQQEQQGQQDDKLPCLSNPYLSALEDPIEKVMENMDAWLDNVGVYGVQATDQKYYEHDHERYFPFNPAVKCDDGQMICVGGPCASDGAKVVCGLQKLREGCVVYSIGSNNQWEFEQEILEWTSCEVHTFDCTGDISRFIVPDNPRLHFHHVCLTAYADHPPKRSNEVDGEYWSLLDMQRKLGHKRINLLKMDIEGFEFDVFTSWPELAHHELAEELLLPHQIVAELHYQSRFPELSYVLTATGLVHLQQHFLRMGYVVAHREDNRRCKHCTELTLIRARCPSTGVYATEALAVDGIENDGAHVAPANLRLHTNEEIEPLRRSRNASSLGGVEANKKKETKKKENKKERKTKNI